MRARGFGSPRSRIRAAGTLTLFLALCLTGPLAGTTFAQNPVPLINQPLVPAAVAPGGPSFTLTVNGTGFVPDSVVNWNGSPRPTTFVSAAQLTATIPDTDIANPGTASITVVNPVPGGGASNVVFLPVTDPTMGIAMARSLYGASTNPRAIVAGDFNGDGRLDLAAPYSTGVGTDVLAIWLGGGDGTFLLHSQVLVAYAAALVTGDFNGDGRLDLAAQSAYAGPQMTIVLGNGDGTFQIGATFVLAPGSSSHVVGDLNGDGALDIAVGDPTGVSLFFGNGDGTFQTPVLIPLESTTGQLVAGDFNNDGVLDLAAQGRQSTSDACRLLIGNGDGTFQSPVLIPLLGYWNSMERNYVYGFGFTAADFNDDGTLDIAVGCDTAWVCVLPGNGDGTFQHEHLSFTTLHSSQSIRLAEFNGDGKLDLVVATDESHGVCVMLAHGDGTFGYSLFVPGGSGAWDISPGDFNGDGRIDLAVANGYSIAEFLQVPSVSFSPSSLSFGSQLVGTSSAPQSVTLTYNGAPLAISSIAITGANSSSFTETNTCGAGLAPGASCTISVTFTPQVTGNLTANVSVTDNAPGSPQTIPLYGQSISAATVTLSPTQLTFSSQLVGTTSPAQAVTLSNTGTGPLIIFGISTDRTVFAQTNNCGALPATVAVGASCQINVTFTPASAGTILGLLVITDDAAGSPHAVSLTGTGIAPLVVLSPSSLSFGDQRIYTTSAPQTVTLTNTGNAVLNITRIAVGGDFAQTNNCGASVAAGGSCTIDVTFHPTQTWLRTATLRITDDAADSPQTVDLSGTGTFSRIELRPTYLSFGNQALGTTSAPKAVTLYSTGTAPVTITGISISGTFAQTNNCVSPLAPRTDCTIQVTFTPPPTVAGGQAGELEVVRAMPGGANRARLAGVGLGPVATLSATSLNFGNQAVGTTSTPRLVNLSNTGNAPMTVTSITADGNFAQTNNCPASLAGRSYCTISVTFTPPPTVAGGQGGTLTIVDDAAGSPHAVALTGIGVGAVAKLSAASLDFGNQPLGNSSAPKLVNLSNTGNAPMDITSITADGHFAQTNNCPASLAGRSYCTISVTFTPTARGARSGAITIVDDAAGSPHTVPLSGTGAIAGAAELSTTSLVFAGQLLGTTSANHTVTLSNSGDLPLGILNIVASGDFAQTNNCGTSLVGGASCTLSVTFTPTAAGSRTGALTITDNASGSPRTVALSGAGQDFSLGAFTTARSVSPGMTARFNLLLMPQGGFQQTVSLACSGAPARATCLVRPSSVTPNGVNNVSVALEVVTTAPAASAPRDGGWRMSLPPGGWPLATTLALLGVLALLAGAILRRASSSARLRLLPVLGACLLLVALVWAACGGGGGAAPPPHSGTPAGTYTLTVTGTVTTGSGNLSHDLTLTLKVN